jgi:Na+-driven multidrug efflux pump
VAGVWLVGPLLAGVWADAATQAYGEPYLQLYFAGIVFTWGYLLCTALYRGAGDVLTPLKLAVGVSLLQMGLNYLFIFGAGPMPALSVKGAAVGGLVARSVGLFAFLFLLRRGAGPLYLQNLFVTENPESLGSEGTPRSLGPSHTRFGLDFSVMKQLLSIGVPMALANVLRHGSRLVYLSIPRVMVSLAVPWFLTKAVAVQAALGFALQVRMLGVLVALAFQTAAATLVGQAIGKGDDAHAESLGRRSVQLLGVVMGTIAVLLILLADPVAALFIEAPDVAAVGARALRWFSIGQLFSSLSIGLQGALMGAGDTLPALRYTLLSEWFVLLPLSTLLAYVEWMPDGMLAAWVVAPMLTFFLMQRRFRSGHWKELRGANP